MTNRSVLALLVAAACGNGGHAKVDAAVAIDSPADSQMLDGPPIGCSGGKTIFLVRGGGTYVSGSADDATTNTTKILPSGSYAVPAYPYGDASWDTLKTCVASAFAPFGVNVTDVDPDTAPHHEIVFTTTYNGWPGGSANVGSISSLTCPGSGSGPAANGIAFVFAEAYGDRPADHCELGVSQLASEIAALDHTRDCHDFLGGYQTPCGPKAFLDKPVQCGEFSDRNCQCGGATQNSFQGMKTALCP